MAPSVAAGTGAGQESMPLVTSVQVNVTVALALFQPAAFGAGVMVAVMVGGVLSRLIVAAVEAVFPALSTAVPEIACWAPSTAT